MSRQVERADAQQHGDDDEADGDLVGDHLRRRAQRAEEGVFRVGRPARHDDAVDAERRDREQIEDADIDVGEHHAGVERDHRPGDQRQDEGDHRRQDEHDPVGAGRDDGFLEQQLEAVGDRLQQAERADHVRALAQLHGRDDLALGIASGRRRQSAAAPRSRRSGRRSMAPGSRYPFQRSAMGAGAFPGRAAERSVHCAMVAEARLIGSVM